MEFVGLGWGGDVVGEFGGFDGRCVFYACACGVEGVEECAGVAFDVDVAEDGVLDVGEEDALLTGAGDVGEREAGEGLARVQRGGFDEDRDIVDVDVVEVEVAEDGDACVTGDGVLVLDATPEAFDAEEPAAARCDAGYCSRNSIRLSPG